MRKSHLSVICLASLVAIGRCCMVGGVWRYGGPYYDDYDYQGRGRFGTGLGNTGQSNTGFIGYGFGIGGLGLLLSLLFNPHFHRPPPPPPREVHHHHHYFHREGGSYDYKYTQDRPHWGYNKGPSSGSPPGSDDRGYHGFSSFFRNMFHR